MKQRVARDEYGSERFGGLELWVVLTAKQRARTLSLCGGRGVTEGSDVLTLHKCPLTAGVQKGRLKMPNLEAES